MKKSQMISKIASVIINHNEPDCVVSREKALKIAEVILEVQREAGMLPPTASLGKLGLRDNAWEDEDEKK